jgi:signal transduction histidine kinase
MSGAAAEGGVPADGEWELKLALEAAELGRWDWHLAQDRVRADRRARALFALGDDDPLDSLGSLFRHVHADDVEHLWACDAAARAGQPFHAELRVAGPGGAVRWLRVDARCDPRTAGAACRVVGVVADVSARRGAEASLRRDQELLEAQVLERTERLTLTNTALANEVEERRAAEAQVRELLGQLVSAEEEERRRVSRELHDTVGQHLTALTIGLRMIADTPQLPPDVREQLARLQSSAQRLDEDVERLSHSLGPRALDDLGLDDALQQHAAEWSRESGVELNLHCRGLAGRRWEPLLETTVFRFVQEALTNVARHAGASQVTVIAERRYGELRAIVEDNGVGFDAEAADARPRRGLGLRGMAERAALAGGRIEIESRPGRGTTLFLALPLATA